MSTSATYSLSTPAFPRVRTRSSTILERLHRPRSAMAVFVVGLLMATAYLLLVNDTATVGLSMKRYDRELQQLQEETRQLEIALANLQSFSTVERTGAALKLTEQVSADVLEIPDQNVAAR